MPLSFLSFFLSSIHSFLQSFILSQSFFLLPAPQVFALFAAAVLPAIFDRQRSIEQELNLVSSSSCCFCCCIHRHLDTLRQTLLFRLLRQRRYLFVCSLDQTKQYFLLKFYFFLSSLSLQSRSIKTINMRALESPKVSSLERSICWHRCCCCCCCC